MRRCLLLLVILCATLLSPRATLAQDPPEGVPNRAIEATVSSIIDGDKIVVEVGGEDEDVLLSGIDAPEEGECFAEESAERVEELAPEESTIWLEQSEADRDSKDRLIRYVWVPGEDGEKAFLLNTKLVREGFAGFDDSKDSPRYFENIEEAEASAKDGDKGLWGACGDLHVDADGDEPESDADESRCVSVDQALIDGIASGLDAGLSLRGGQAVKSNDFENVYFIAADIQGPGLEGDGDIAVWASNSLEVGGGLILAVDAVAQEFSDWPDGDSTDAQTSIGDDGVSEAIDCASDAL